MPAGELNGLVRPGQDRHAERRVRASMPIRASAVVVVFAVTGAVLAKAADEHGGHADEDVDAIAMAVISSVMLRPASLSCAGRAAGLTERSR